MTNRNRLATAGATGAALASALIFIPSAHADLAPSSTDVVGVGSDVVQYAVDFAADGDYKGNPGYNAAGNVNRLVNFDSTGDANGRNGYLQGSTTPLYPTIVLRAGSSPVQRPNGGGAGLTALINDGTNGVSANKINFARSPNLPTAAQQASAQANLGSQLHVVQIATDSQLIAVSTTTNAPAKLTPTDLVNIYNGTYTKWNQVPGYTGSAGGQTIVPLIPQAGAGVRTTFLKALKAANGGTDITVAGNVRNVEQNDPTALSSLPSNERANAILPFPKSRLALYNKSYFLDPVTPYNAASAASPIAAGVKLLTATGSFSTPLPYYIIFRQKDLTSTTPWQPGSTLNWAKALFSNSGATPFFKSNPGKALIAASGATPAYSDLGVTQSG